MRRPWLILISLWACCVIWAPATELVSKQGARSAPVLDAEAAANAGLSLKEATEAQKLYATKCMRCHKSYDPGSYSQPQWESWMTKMRKKARLASEQDALLSRYLAAYRSAAPVVSTNLSARSVRSIDPAQ